MLMRSEGAEGSSASSDCDDPLVVIACAAESDACPATCREGAKEDEQAAPKSGSLVVTAVASNSKSVIAGGVNDLDTLTFKTSEEVELTKVTLERYGYSRAYDVVDIRLEDEDGNKIADAGSLNSKDQVTLSVKKDYRSIDGTLNATVVVRTRSLPADAPYNLETDGTPMKQGSSLGFKVVDVKSTAKDVDLGGYGANLYDIVSYKAGTLTLNTTAADKRNNYEAGESYEVAKFKATNNGTNAISVNGFTLHNYGTLAAQDFVENVVVTANGEEVSGVKYSFNKDDDDLVISFKTVEIAAGKKVTFAVNASFNEEFDEYSKYVAFALQETDDISAVESKTSARVSVDAAAAALLNTSIVYDGTTNNRWELADGANAGNAWPWPVYTFNGGKVKFTSEKLGNIDAAAGASDVVIAKGTLEISEPIKTTFTVDTKTAGVIDSLTMIIAGEEFDGTKQANNKDFLFSNIEIEKGGKIEFRADIVSDDNIKGTTISMDSFKFPLGANTKYIDKTKGNVAEIAGSLTFAKLTVQAAKGALENTLTKEVEFIKGEASRKVVFEGTYTAKKADVYLNEFEVTAVGLPSIAANNVEFYLFIDGEEVANAHPADNKTFSNVKVAGGEKVSIKVEAEVDSNNLAAGDTYTILLGGEDVDNLAIKTADANTVLMKVVEKGSVTVSTAAASKSTVLLKAANTSVAKFTVKPENSDNKDLYLEDLRITVTNGAGRLAPNQIRVKIAGTEEDGEDSRYYTDKPYNVGDVVFEAGNFYSNNTAIPAAGEAWTVEHWTAIAAHNPANTYDADDLVVNGTAVYKCKADITAHAWDADEWIFVADQDSIFYDLNEELGDGVNVEVIIKNKADAAGVVSVRVDEVNGKSAGTKVFTKRFESALVTLHTEDKDGTTKVVLGVEKENSSDKIYDVTIFAEGMPAGTAAKLLTTDEVVDADDFEVSAAGDKSTHFITAISYCVNNDGCEAPKCTAGATAKWNVDDPTTWLDDTAYCATTFVPATAGYVMIDKATYNDYFKDGGSYAKIFKVD